MTILFLDCETSVYNKGHPFDPRNKLISYSYAFDNDNVIFKYYNDPDFIGCLSMAMERATKVVGFNIKFDLHWVFLQHVVHPVACTVYDCQLAEFILSGQELPYDSLNEALARYGLPTKIDAVKEYWDAGISTEDIPIGILEEYNKWDVYTTRLLYQTQQQILSEKQKRLIELEGEDLKALAAAERAGIKFDREKANDKLSKLAPELADLEARLATYLPPGIPDGCWNWDSGDHLSCLLYGGTLEFRYVSEVLTYKTGQRAGQPYNRWSTMSVNFPARFKPLAGTEVAKTRDDPMATTRFYQTDAPTLLQLKSKSTDNQNILKLLQSRADKIKVVEMTEGIINKINEKNWVDNYIHPQFNQNVVITGRLSSSQPNMQNQPPEIDELLISRYVD